MQNKSRLTIISAIFLFGMVLAVGLAIAGGDHMKATEEGTGYLWTEKRGEEAATEATVWLKEDGEAVITIKCKVDFTFTGKWHGNLDEDGPKDLEILKGFGGIDAKAPGKVRIKGKTFDNLHFHGESEGAGGEYKVQFKPN